MNALFLTLLLVLLSLAPLTAQRTTSADLEKAAETITVTPSGGDFSAGDEIRISFPAAMIPLEAIGAAASIPITILPNIAFTAEWRSTSLLVLKVTGPLTPGQAYTLDLSPNLTDGDGNPLPTSSWQAVAFQAPALDVKSRFRPQGDRLAAMPEVDLRVNYPVSVANVRQSVFFQNRDTRRRHATAVLLPAVGDGSDDDSDWDRALSHLQVTPRTPLPVDGTYDLIIDGLADAATQTSLPAVQAIPLGNTRAVTVTDVSVHTHPLEKPIIHLKTTGAFDNTTLTPEAVLLEPAIADLKVLNTPSFVRLQGDFDTSQTYRVTFKDSVIGASGYPLASHGPYEATFKGRQPAILFPQATFYQRVARGLDVTVMQSHCPETTWTLARIPLAKLSVVHHRLKEFEGSARDPFTGEHVGPFQTELLVDALELETAARGTLPGAGLHDVRYASIQWRPEEGTLTSGAYLLEAHAQLPNGELVGNRSIVYFNEIVLHRRFTHDSCLLKAFAMDDGRPIANATLTVIDPDNVKLGETVTNGNGVATLSRAPLEPSKHPGAAYFILRSSSGGAIQPYRGARFHSSGWVSSRLSQGRDRATLAGDAFADRNLYRPGEAIHVKGTVRSRRTEPSGAYHLSIPEGEVSWSIRQGYRGAPLAQGKADLDAYGGWEATWEIPAGAKLGDYRMAYQMGELSDTVYFQVEEYKPPLFEIQLTQEANPDRLQIRSHYFHGSPNAGARVEWDLAWSEDDSWDEEYRKTDAHSPFRQEALNNTLQEGILTLDEHGLATIDLAVPFPKPWPCGQFRAFLNVAILSPEGQVVEAAEAFQVTPQALVPSIKWERLPDSDDLLVHLRTRDREGAIVDGQPMALTIYRKETHTVKERLGPSVYRYRNTPQFHIETQANVTTGQSFRFTPKTSAHYVAYAKLSGLEGSHGVSDLIHVVGDEPGYYEIRNDGEITVRTDKERYVAGQETAQLAVESPFGGQAWVCVETDTLLDEFLIDLPSNNTPISLPIKHSYHPNVHASVYLLRPGGADRLPSERYGSVTIEVDRPDLVLDVAPSLTVNTLEPGSPAEGVVEVRCQGQPVANADVTVFAVNRAVHELGQWTMPAWFPKMYPRRFLNVAAYRGLAEHFEKFEESEVTEKGFLIGGGAYAPEIEGAGPQSFRQDFRALAFWESSLRTDNAGNATFAFEAPDSLTSYHLVALAQTKEHQFGQGDATFEVKKRLMVEPGLPRFVRQGDAIDLRAVVRQNYREEITARVVASVEGDIEWLTEPTALVLSLQQNVPQAVALPIKVLGGDAVVVRFEAHGEGDPQLRDAVEVTLPVHAPGIRQRTGHFGRIPKTLATYPLHEQLPDTWKQSEGDFRLTLSHTPFLPELQSLPEVLDYPHGCLEQRTVRYLSYAIMLSLLDYLPELQDRHGNYAERLEEAVAFYDNHLLSNGFLPYWQGGTTPNDWVTLLAYWFKESVKAQGMAIPESLDTELTKAHLILAQGRRDHPKISLTTRAFALFVHAESGQALGELAPLFVDLHARRGDMETDALTFLLLAMERQDFMAKEQTALAKVIRSERREREIAFDPNHFGSSHRDNTLRWLTECRLASSPLAQRQVSEAYLKESEAQGNRLLSTQEHFWRAVLLGQMVALDHQHTFEAASLQPAPDLISKNAVSIAWRTRSLEHLRDLALQLGEGSSDRHYLLEATVVRTPDTTTKMEDRGFRLERVVTNLTDPTRLGTEEAPFALGDELLLTYRFESKQHQHYVALVDELPSGLEIVNFNLPQVAMVYQLPNDVRATLSLSHSEFRDQSANLYFDNVPLGHHVYAVLARVTAAGEVTWPAAQISPMYQPYVTGLAAGRRVHSDS